MKTDKVSEEIDYSAVGLKAGLEIHQQLDCGKLFCSCPGVLRNDAPDFIVTRKLHGVAGEQGTIDAAAKYQASLDKTFVYQGYKDNTCLVELDEEPPHSLNSEALAIALQLSELLHAQPLKATQVMRKIVVDGSNTSGFQRTVLIATDGFITTSYGRVGIATICLEEDAARIVEKKKDSTIYRLDRLGIPLIEIATDPELYTPEQVKEAALLLGEILRACKVKRGLGTIRQDVNVSIKGHDRVEIKGFQDPAMMITTVDNEILRQQKDLKDKKKLGEVRNALPSGESEFLRPMPGAARMYPETDVLLLRINRSMIDEAKRNLPKMKSELKDDLKKYNLHDEILKLILDEHLVDEFKELISVHSDAGIVGKMLVLYPKELAKKSNLSLDAVREKLSNDVLVSILEALNKKKIQDSQVKEVLERIVSGIDLEKALHFEKQDLNMVEEQVMKLIKEKPGLQVNAYMGLLIQEFKGKVDGKTLMELIRKYAK